MIKTGNTRIFWFRFCEIWTNFEINFRAKLWRRARFITYNIFLRKVERTAVFFLSSFSPWEFLRIFEKLQESGSKFFVDPTELFQSSLNKPLNFFLKYKGLPLVIISIMWDRKVENVHEQHCRDVSNYPEVNFRSRLLQKLFP